MSQIGVVAKIVAKPGKEEETLEELKLMIAPTRKEPGCIRYILHRSAENPAEYWFVEEWTSKAMLDDQMKTPHFLNLEKRAQELTESAEVVVLEPLN